MKAILILTTIAAVFAAASAHAEAQAGANVNVQSTPQGSTVVIQGAATIPLSKTVTLTPQVQVVIPPPITQAPPVVNGGMGVNVRL